ncbi:hypothetical protein VII00023_00265 [Vibrio ichthyoenteri ATCC 700023]|uniref:Uncharacterized protein n=1 Tax=Vibrio ichthyoenteri ATCC 700023 TaxID=870968 RepID=F9RX10_9VIBR|nr:hypothetical protein [Vibrio ichthyoenteri]EGU48583.1 hypothetical protein VII00023_00265 [Vibrio ichthyoenteri ATCC 700023]
MKNTILPLAFSISVLLSGQSFAEDFVPNATPAASVENAGLDAQQAATLAPFEQQEIVEYISAEQQIFDYMDQKNWQQGWDPDKKRLFVVNMQQFDSEDPSYDDSFITKRSQYATIATMGAKAEMVEYMRTTMSAVDMLTAPGTDVHAELNEKYVRAEKKLNAQKRELVKIIAELDQAEADKLAGITIEDRAEATWDAVIKRIDSNYDAATIEESKRKKYEKVKQRFADASSELDVLEQQASTLKGEIKLESTSMVETLAKAPILGASVLVQAESWDAESEVYEVATLMVWSPKLEKAAKSIITGEMLPLKPKNGLSVHDWLKKQEVATMVGPRQFVDQSGERWFIGAFGMPADGASSLVRKNRGIADAMAKKEAAVALYADIETQKQAAIAMQTRSSDLGSKDNTEVATSFSEATRQSVENRHINGLSKLFSRTVVHPISQQKIYVVAYGISAKAASEALAIEYSAFDAGATANRANNLKAAERASLESNFETSKTEVAAKPQASQSKNAATPSTIVPAPKKSATNSSTLLNAPDFSDDDF